MAPNTVSTASTDPIAPLIDSAGIKVTFPNAEHDVIAVEDASFALYRGRILGVVGESGSGKSQLFKALTGLAAGADVAGQVLFEGANLLAVPPQALAAIRGRRIAYIFQDPMTALNPFLRISTQMTEVATHHLGLGHEAAKARALEMLEKVRIPDAAKRLSSFPHELSGGMRQRVVIAMAMMGDPDILIADEPTTALDATVQVQILDLLRGLCDDEGLAIALISHDMGVMAKVADDVMVMYAGRVVERGPAEKVLAAPCHPYTQRLIDSTPDLERPLDDVPVGIAGQLPTAGSPRQRCLFEERCFRTEAVCQTTQPPLLHTSGEHVVACHFALDAPKAVN